MAGRPKTRAKRARDAAGDAVGEPLNARVHDARGPAHAHAPANARTRAAYPGAASRKVVDEATADTLQTFADVLGAGVRIDVERIRPPWCAGWLDEFEVEPEGMSLGDIRRYIRDEWGGEVFRIAAVDPGGRPYMVRTIKISGPPRLGGELLSRAKWEHYTNPSSADANTNTNDLTQALLLKMVDRQGDNGTLELLRDMHKRSDATLGAVVKSALERHNAPAAEPSSFRDQVNQLTEGMQAVDSLRGQLAAGIVAPEPDEETSLASKVAQEYVLHAMRDSMGGGNGSGAPPGAVGGPTPQNSVAQPGPSNPHPWTIPDGRH